MSVVGEVIVERYEIEELVGTGGMSSVFKARDRLLERPVALKILHEQYTLDPEYVERFRREARAVAQLTHPNIVTVIDRGEQGGRQFIVFEYVDGENLKQLVGREGPLPVREAIRVHGDRLERVLVEERGGPQIEAVARFGPQQRDPLQPEQEAHRMAVGHGGRRYRAQAAGSDAFPYGYP